MKRTITLVGGLVCIVLAVIWFNKEDQDREVVQTFDSKREYSDEYLNKNAQMLTESIQTRLKDEHILDISSIGIHYKKKEIHIQVKGTQQYVDEVEKSIKEIVHEMAKETIFKDYSIIVYRQIIDNADQTSDQNKQLGKITMTIQASLKVKGYEEIENIMTEKLPNKLIINVYTSIEKSDSPNINRGKRIEEDIREALTEGTSPLIADNETLKVKVYTKNREKLN
ncbi:hypothetical protein JFL43_04685 [Viridibacillus sp. YIM B01967]|uniref:DUF4030 domain-containing protein n=1 Tax=Viridibacillus soli TaxID=2798301 RepID=A0ABS1H425_9BACL|nr:hypothetical protein [Viridibacillus soli]MBK3494164.1 hypothetical protein [Viridibacillus soli]